MDSSRRPVGLLLLFPLLAAYHPARAETLVYSTGEFVNSEWSSVITGTGASVATTDVNGGNPDAYRRVSLTVAPFQSVANRQLWKIAVFTPATQGPITSVSVSYDVARVFTSVAGATQIAKGISVQQGGVVHTLTTGVSIATPPNWESFSSGNIVPLFPGVNWTNGTEITFGFHDSVSTSQTGFTIDGGYDNFRVIITYAPPTPGITYYFPHLAVGGGWQTTLTYVNSSTEPATCVTTFLSESGVPLFISFGGTAVSSRTDTITPGATLHEQTQGDLNTSTVQGWARAQCTGPVKASLLFRSYGQGVPMGEAGVNAMTSPTSKFITFAQTQTGVAYANPSGQAANVTITALDAGGAVLGSKNLTLQPGEHGSAIVGPLLGLASFTGSVQVTATVPIVSLSLNFEASPVFSSLPPGDLTGPTPPVTSINYYFSHLALGGGWQTTLTYVNFSAQAVTCVTTFLSESAAPLPVSFGGPAVSSRTDTIAAGATTHVQTQGDVNTPTVQGWARAQCDGRVKASLLFRSYNQGIALGEAGVNAMTAPAARFVTFAETQTGVAYANPSAQAATITITALDRAGNVLGTKNLTFQPGEHGSAIVGPALGLAGFIGSIQITATAPIVSLSLNFEAAPVFSSLPPGEPDL